MQDCVYEIEIRFSQPDELNQKTFHFYFQCYPTKNDTLRALEKSIQYHEYQAGKDTAMGYMYSCFVDAKKVVEEMVNDWFTVGLCGVRPSRYAYGTVTLDMHYVIDNNAAKG